MHITGFVILVCIATHLLVPRECPTEPGILTIYAKWVANEMRANMDTMREMVLRHSDTIILANSHLMMKAISAFSWICPSNVCTPTLETIKFVQAKTYNRASPDVQVLYRKLT